MAAGKSTTAEALALKLDKCVHLRGDVFRRMIASGREEMSAAPSEEAVRQLHLRYRLTAEAAKTYFDGGFPLWFKTTITAKRCPVCCGCCKVIP